MSKTTFHRISITTHQKILRQLQELMECFHQHRRRKIFTRRDSRFVSYIINCFLNSKNSFWNQVHYTCPILVFHKQLVCNREINNNILANNFYFPEGSTVLCVNKHGLVWINRPSSSYKAARQQHIILQMANSKRAHETEIQTRGRSTLKGIIIRKQRQTCFDVTTQWHPTGIKICCWKHRHSFFSVNVFQNDPALLQIEVEYYENK